MSGSSSYNTFESEDESTGWLMPSETSLDDELSDELTLLNGDEDCDEDTLSFDALIKLSMRLKKQYNLREASVQLERCDKIWDTIQLVKKMQMDYEDETTRTGDEGDEDDEKETNYSSPADYSHLPETANSSIPYIKYQPVQGNGNKALPNFYLAVKSQKKLYHCVTCGKQYSEKRGLRQHAQKEHGIVIPKAEKKVRSNTDNKTVSHETPENKVVNNSSSRDRENSKSRLSNTSKHSTEQRPRVKREKDTIASPFVLPEPKKEAEAKPAAGETHENHFICPICAAAYHYQRGVTTHMMAVHDMTLAEARSAYSGRKITQTKKPPPKPESPKKPLPKPESPKKSQEIKRENSRVKEETSDDVDSAKTSKTGKVNRCHYLFTCKPCGRKYGAKKDLRTHARNRHNIIIPMTVAPRDGAVTREYKYYTSVRLKDQFARIPYSRSPRSPRSSKRQDKAYRCKIAKSEAQQPKTMRSGRRIIAAPQINRPRRACAVNTSYSECTKEEEEVLQRELIFTNASGQSAKPLGQSAKPSGESAKPPSSQATPCFLCKKSFVDMRKHLIDYHRINCPDTILPLTANVAAMEKNIEKHNDNDSESAAIEKDIEKDNDNDSESAASSGTVERPAQLAGKLSRNQRKYLQQKERMKEAENDPNVRIFVVKRGTRKNRRAFKCVLCSKVFYGLRKLREHQDKYTINNVLQAHEPPTQRRKNRKTTVLKDPVVDPLALTDFVDSSRSESRGNASDDEETKTTRRKRRISSSDELLSSSSEHRSKRRKIEKPNEFANVGSESTIDSAQYNNEIENEMVMSEMDCGFNEDETPTNPRDTRDSSDRDSGIGISITIKKRNNSYEVVEKDSGDDDKSKDFEHSKDDNTCSDSSSDVPPVNFVNDDQEERRREILNSLDHSVEENVVESASTDADYEDDRKFGKKNEEESSCPSDDKEANYLWKAEEHCGEEANSSLPGKVPSLKLMCRTVLRNDDFTNLNTNDTGSHQCPVCCRFYPTERDVTVHMLEHKVPRTDFRATRVHVIPSSALIRYGRRPV